MGRASRGSRVSLCLFGVLVACGGGRTGGADEPEAPTPPGRDLSRPASRPAPTLAGASYLPASSLVVTLPAGWSAHLGTQFDPDVYDEWALRPADVLAWTADTREGAIPPVVVEVYVRPCDAPIPGFRKGMYGPKSWPTSMLGEPPAGWEGWQVQPPPNDDTRNGSWAGTGCRPGPMPLRVVVYWTNAGQYERRFGNALDELARALVAGVERSGTSPWAEGGRLPLALAGVDVPVTTKEFVAVGMVSIPSVGWADLVGVKSGAKAVAAIAVARYEGSCDTFAMASNLGDVAAPSWFPVPFVLASKVGPANPVVICQPQGTGARLFMIQYDPSATEEALGRDVAPMLASIVDAVQRPAPLAYEYVSIGGGDRKLRLDDGWQWSPHGMTSVRKALFLSRVVAPFQSASIKRVPGTCAAPAGEVAVEPSPWPGATVTKGDVTAHARWQAGAECIVVQLTASTMDDEVTARLIESLVAGFQAP